MFHKEFLSKITNISFSSKGSGIGARHCYDNKFYAIRYETNLTAAIRTFMYEKTTEFQGCSWLEPLGHGTHSRFFVIQRNWQ